MKQEIKKLKGIAGELLKICELEEKKTIFTFLVPEAHDCLLLPGVKEKVEEFLSQTNSCVAQVVFKSEKQGFTPEEDVELVDCVDDLLEINLMLFGEIQQNIKDAERYRWLRNTQSKEFRNFEPQRIGDISPIYVADSDNTAVGEEGEELDNAIDKAMERNPE
jgi:hypothetical protein